MVEEVICANRALATEQVATKADCWYDFAEFIWDRIRHLAPRARLLRGPAHLGPTLERVGSDLDIFIPGDLAAARAFLKKQGFCRVCSPKAHLERYQLRRPDLPQPYTVELYKVERWGLGFQITNNIRVPIDPPAACLLRAILDGKGTTCFENEQNGPPWVSGSEGITFGPLGRALWRAGLIRLLSLYLIVKGVIRPDLPLILRNLGLGFAYWAWQLTRKSGLEVALLGVDGTGKSSLANALAHLPAPVRVVYMGPHDYETRIMRFAIRHDLPLAVRQLAYRYELSVRRLYGWLLARRGWIVIYDRHPAERLDPRQGSLKNLIKNGLDRLYAWPVDLTFWLTGDYPTLYLRKREYSPTYLQAIDQRFRAVLQHYKIPFERIDVTKNDLRSTTAIISNHILAKYDDRFSVDSSPGILRATLA